MVDQGEIRIDTDLHTGMVSIVVREPLSITRSTARITVGEFLELAAKMTLEMIAHQRETMARVAAGIQAGPKQ